MRLVDAVFARIKELMKEKGMSMYRLAMNAGCLGQRLRPYL